MDELSKWRRVVEIDGYATSYAFTEPLQAFMSFSVLCTSVTDQSVTILLYWTRVNDGKLVTAAVWLVWLLVLRYVE